MGSDELKLCRKVRLLLQIVSYFDCDDLSLRWLRDSIVQFGFFLVCCATVIVLVVGIGLEVVDLCEVHGLARVVLRGNQRQFVLVVSGLATGPRHYVNRLLDCDVLVCCRATVLEVFFDRVRL